MPVDPIELPYVFNGQVKPGIWRYLLPKEVHAYDIPQERQSTCDDCPQAKFEGYDPVYRCCSYHPIMPNFLLGLALRQPTSAAAVDKLIGEGWVLPEGMQRTPQQWADYLIGLGESGFGEAQVRCPNLNPANGFCNVHAFRNAVCSTFFCIHDHGNKGSHFWLAIEELVSQMESALGQWALNENGFDTKAYYKRMDELAPDMKSVADPVTKCWSKRARKHLWGRHYGKERALLQRCGQSVADNRDKLWEIASSSPILEAVTFDKAMDKLIPAKHRDQIDPEDLDYDAEEVPLKELLGTVRRRYRQLRKVPERLRLSPRVKIEKNPRDDAESRANAHKPFRVDLFCRTKGETVDTTEFLSEAEVAVLNLFRRGRSVSERTLGLPPFKKLTRPMEFLAEQVGKRTLIQPD